MKDLSDSEFDDIFRKRVEESHPPFEEDAWSSMEKKLRRRDRIILLRNTSAVLIFCILLAGSFYLFYQPKEDQSLAKQKKEQNDVRVDNDTDSVINIGSTEDILEGKKPGIAKVTTDKKRPTSDISKDFFEVSNKTISHPKPPTSADSSKALPVDISNQDNQAVAVLPDVKSNENDIQDTEKPEESIKVKKRIPIRFGLALSAGPDFNSTTSIAGNKPTLSIGLLLDAAVSKKISFSTGVRYGAKLYTASAASYGVTNPDIRNSITYIDGSCNVLEIPLRASYELLNNNRKSLKLNAGLSSYLMLKEKYVFKYRPESYVEDYILEKHNSNQHYFGVADISATYRVKTKTSKVEFGIEPYVKIPLGGVGEGKVRLKSSGITLNMFYDLSKKNKQ